MKIKRINFILILECIQIIDENDSLKPLYEFLLEKGFSKGKITKISDTLQYLMY